MNDDWSPLDLALADGSRIEGSKWRMEGDILECLVQGKHYSIDAGRDLTIGLNRFLKVLKGEVFFQEVKLQSCLDCLHFDMSGMARDMGHGRGGMCLLHKMHVYICYKCNDYLSMKLLRPKWRPSLPVDINARATAFKHYTDGHSPFTILSNGSTVFLDASTEWGKEACCHLIELVCTTAPDFVVRNMDDGNYLVTFKDNVYAVVMRDEYTINRDEIHKGAEKGGMLADEALLGLPDAPVEHRYVGLLARARLFMDAEEKRIVLAVPKEK